MPSTKHEVNKDTEKTEPTQSGEATARGFRVHIAPSAYRAFETAENLTKPDKDERNDQQGDDVTWARGWR